MRLFSPLSILLFVVAWTGIFIVIARYYFYSAHQSWFKDEEQSILVKIDNLDARNMRQLNQLYAEIKNLQDMFLEIRKEIGGIKPKPSLKTRNPRETIEPSIAVLVIACNRVDYIRRTLDELLKYRPSAGLFPVIVSQDCGHQPTADIIASYGSRLTHIKHTNLSKIVIPKSQRKIKNSAAETGYYKISRHYKWALTQVFEEMHHDYVIVIEDDLIIAPDFYMYFLALRHLLNSDPTIMCISAYNDNGKPEHINDQQNDHLYRTDFFPGLGWMLNKGVWLELKQKWPLAYWDDWMREPEQRKERACIRPEVSRTKTIGKTGVSVGMFFKNHLQYIQLNSNPIDFTKRNMSYLLKEVYDREFVGAVHRLPLGNLQEVIHGTVLHEEVRVQYHSNKEFEAMAKQLKIMSDHKSGVPRTAYQGIVSLVFRNKRIHLVPSDPWLGYKY